MARECKDRGVPIRIGVNAGSLDTRLYKKYGGATARGAGRVGPDRAGPVRRGRLRRRQDLGQGVQRAADDRGLPPAVRGHRPSAAPRRDRGRAAAGRDSSRARPGSPPCWPRASATPSATRSPPTRSRRPRPAASCSRRSGLRERKNVDLIACPSCGRAEIDVFKVAQEAQAALEAKAAADPGRGHGLRGQRARARPGRPTSASPPAATGATCSSRARSCGWSPRTRWSSALVEEAEKLVKEGVEARLAAADAGAAAEAEKDRRALLDAKGDDANHSEARVELIDKRLADGVNRGRRRPGWVETGDMAADQLELRPIEPDEIPAFVRAVERGIRQRAGRRRAGLLGSRSPSPTSASPCSTAGRIVATAAWNGYELTLPAGRRPPVRSSPCRA